jgi:hypothetical protein
VDGSDEFTSKVNPYESPGHYIDTDPEEVVVEIVRGPATAWRDGSRMVVPRNGAPILPSRCIKTGEPSLPEYRFREHVSGLHPNHPLTLFKWPVSPKWIANSERGRTIGKICLVASLGFAAATMVLPAFRFQVFQIPITSTGMGALAIFTFMFGIGAWASSSREFLCLVDVQYEYVWLEGAHRDFLQELPPWTAATSSRAR